MAELTGSLGDSNLGFRVNALEQQAELSDLKRQLDGATAQGRRQEQRLRQHRNSLRELIRQLEEVEERVDGVQRRVDSVSKSIHRSAEAVGMQERRAQQLDQLANSSALKRGASGAIVHGSPDAKTSHGSRLDMKTDDKLEELERRLWQATQDFDRRLVEEAERRAAGQEEVLGVLGQGVQQMRSEQARHASELNDNLRAEQRRWRQCISDAQAQQSEQQQLIEALEARLDTAVEALSLEYKNLYSALPKILPSVTASVQKSPREPLKGEQSQRAVTQGSSHPARRQKHSHHSASESPHGEREAARENQIRSEHSQSDHDRRSHIHRHPALHHHHPTDHRHHHPADQHHHHPADQHHHHPADQHHHHHLADQHHHPNPDILMRLEALEERYRETRSQGQGSVQSSPRNRASAEAAVTATLPAAEGVPPTRTNVTGVYQGLGLTPPAGLTVPPSFITPAQCLPTVPALSTTPEPPWQSAMQSLAPSRSTWLDARPAPSKGFSPRSAPQEEDIPFKKQVNGQEMVRSQSQRQVQNQTLVHPQRRSVSPDSPALPWSPIGGSLGPAVPKPRGDGSPPSSPGPGLGRNSPPLEPPMSHPSYPQAFTATRLPAPPGGVNMRECFA